MYRCVGVVFGLVAFFFLLLRQGTYTSNEASSITSQEHKSPTPLLGSDFTLFFPLRFCTFRSPGQGQLTQELFLKLHGKVTARFQQTSSCHGHMLLQKVSLLSAGGRAPPEPGTPFSTPPTPTWFVN